MKTFEIMFTDLTPEAQQAFVEFLGDEPGNKEFFPIATVDIDDGDD